MSEQLRLVAPEQAELFETGRSIFDYYSIENEVRFVSETARLPEEDVRFYIRQNVLRFLGEFAGEIPYTRISLMLGPHGLEFAGIRTSPIYARSAEIAGEESREQNELKGYQKIEKTLLDGENGATWISPPLYGDYGFVFHFEKDPTSQRVDEYIVRYPEQRGSVQTSQELLSSLSPILFYSNEAAFLRNPLVTTSSSPALEAILVSLGVEEADIQRSKKYEYLLEMRLSSVIDEYIDCILKKDENGAKKILIACFNYAKALKGELDSMSLFSINRLSTPTQHEGVSWLIAYYSTNSPLVTGGSCPVTRPGTNTPFSNLNLLAGLQTGVPLEITVSSQTCPDCSPNKDNHYHCPSCNKRYSDETHLSPSQRTKECSCGFNLNC